MLDAADFVVVPLTPEPLAVEPTMRTIHRLIEPRQLRHAVLLNRIDARIPSQLDTWRDLLDTTWGVPRFDAYLRQYKTQADAPVLGELVTTLRDNRRTTGTISDVTRVGFEMTQQFTPSAEWAVVSMAKVDLAGKLDDARARVEAETPVEDRGLAKFARLTRKDARVRADQDAALTAFAKTLMRRRPVKAERITENTLIRVAIDLLLAHADELRGSTEDELRRLRHFRTSSLRDFRTPQLRNTGSDRQRQSRASALREARTAALPEHRYPRLRQPGCRALR